MTTNLDVYRLNFGSDDAEQDERHGFLDKVFLKTAIYLRIKESNRELIIGRKGSGKSAIFLMLKKALEYENATVIPITSDELSEQKIDQLKKSSLNKDEAFFLYWKYVLFVKVALELLSIAKQPGFQKRMMKVN